MKKFIRFLLYTITGIVLIALFYGLLILIFNYKEASACLLTTGFGFFCVWIFWVGFFCVWIFWEEIINK